MTHQEVIDRILAYHPHLPGYQGCDDWKFGNPEDECRGIVTALVPTVDVIRKAAELGANLLIVHEPTFYTSADGNGWFESFPNAVYEEKAELLRKTGITIWRDHDHMHANDPDSIFTGVFKYLGWEEYVHAEPSRSMFMHFIVDLPEPMKFSALLDHFVEKIGLNGVRYIGRGDDPVQKIAFVGHLYPMEGEVEYSVSVIENLEAGADVLVPGEIIEWTALSYIRDAVQLGKVKGLVNLGHLNWEELGMRYAQDWIGELVPELSVRYVPTGDLYSFHTAK